MTGPHVAQRSNWSGLGRFILPASSSIQNDESTRIIWKFGSSSFGFEDGPVAFRRDLLARGSGRNTSQYSGYAWCALHLAALGSRLPSKSSRQAHAWPPGGAAHLTQDL